MIKWTVQADFVIQADTRGEAWIKASALMERHFHGLVYNRGLIRIRAVSLKPLPDPQDGIALNEPIKAQK